MTSYFLPSGLQVSESELNRWVETGHFTPDDTGVVPVRKVIASLTVDGVVVVEGSHGQFVDITLDAS